MGARKRQSDEFWIIVWNDVKGGIDDGKFVKIEARSVEIEGFEDMDFFVHDGLWDKQTHKVSEGISGMAVSCIEGTEEQAIEAAREILKARGKVETMEAVQLAVEKYGISPRYREEG